MPKPTQQELKNLVKLFLAARDQLIDTVINYRGVGTKVYANTILKQLEKQLKRMERQSAYYVESVIPVEYQKGLDEVYGYFKRNNLMMSPPAAFAQLHGDMIYMVAREMQYQIGQGLEQAGRQVIRYVEDARDDALRMAGLEATGEKLASGSTVRQMQQNLVNKLQSQGFMTVQYGSGSRAYQVSLDAYAAMVARSTTREAGNLARETQLTANGYDLVRMTSHYPTCEICTQFQGRVYSISGNDKRFPPLSRAFSSGYRNIHPNCRHSVHPYVESLQSEEDLAADIARSNRPFEDNRPDAERALYNKQQAQNRQIRQDRYQYERYKARLGDDAPKSFHAFRKLKNAGGEKWDVLQEKYRNHLYSQDYSDIVEMKGKLTNYQVRRWYKTHDESIPNLIDTSLPLESQARQAHTLRNQYRTQARDLMEDQEARKLLDKSNPNVEFEVLLADKKVRKNLSHDEALRDIIKTASKTNPRVNKQFGLEE